VWYNDAGGMMARPKEKFKVGIFSGGGADWYILHIYIDDPQQYVSDLAGIEGIVRLYVEPPNRLSLTTDPRYDASEIITEIEELLDSLTCRESVPDAFSDVET
jgi:hypothetical protein